MTTPVRSKTTRSTRTPPPVDAKREARQPASLPAAARLSSARVSPRESEAPTRLSERERKQVKPTPAAATAREKAVAQPEDLASALDALTLGPKAPGDAKLREKTQQLFARSLQDAGISREAELIKAAFDWLDTQAGRLSPEACGSLARGLFGALSGPTLLHCGRLLLPRATRKDYSVPALEALGRAFVDALPQPVDASAMEPLLTLMQQAATKDAERAGAMCKAVRESLAQHETQQAGPAPEHDGPRGKRGVRVACSEDARRSIEVYAKDERGVISTLLHVPMERKAPRREQEAVGTIFGELTSLIGEAERPFSARRIGAMLDKIFNPSRAYVDEAVAPLFVFVLNVLSCEDMDEQTLDTVLDRVFDPHARVSRLARSLCLYMLVNRLGGNDMGNWRRLAILDRGLASMDTAGSATALREQADWWIAALLQHTGRAENVKHGLCFTLNHILTSGGPAAQARNDALLDASCAAVTGMVDGTLARQLFAAAMRELPEAAMSVELRQRTMRAVARALSGENPPLRTLVDGPGRIEKQPD